MTQLERADLIRAELLEMFPELDRLHQELTRLLGEAQNGPPDGWADGTIDATQYNQLRGIDDQMKRLLLTQLFNSRPGKKT